MYCFSQWDALCCYRISMVSEQRIRLFWRGKHSHSHILLEKKKANMNRWWRVSVISHWRWLLIFCLRFTSQYISGGPSVSQGIKGRPVEHALCTGIRHFHAYSFLSEPMKLYTNIHTNANVNEYFEIDQLGNKYLTTNSAASCRKYGSQLKNNWHKDNIKFIQAHIWSIINGFSPRRG